MIFYDYFIESETLDEIYDMLLWPPNEFGTSKSSFGLYFILKSNFNSFNLLSLAQDS